MMVIADSKTISYSGIMGSMDAEVDECTSNIVLESAWFNPGKVRSTARKLGLHTE